MPTSISPDINVHKAGQIFAPDFRGVISFIWCQVDPN